MLKTDGRSVTYSVHAVMINPFERPDFSPRTTTTSHMLTSVTYRTTITASGFPMFGIASQSWDVI